MNRIITSVDEAATYLGLKKSYLYRLINLGKVPHSKPNGGKIYFDREKLDAWMLGGLTSTGVGVNKLEEYENKIREDERLKVAKDFMAIGKGVKELEHEFCKNNKNTLTQTLKNLQLLSKSELSIALGVSVARVDKWLHDGTLRGTYIGKRCFFRVADLCTLPSKYANRLAAIKPEPGDR